MRINHESPTEIGQGDHLPQTFMLAIPTFGMVPIEFVIGFSRMALPMSSFVESFIAKGMEVGVARNYIAEKYKARSPRPRYLLFIGDDMLVNWDSLILLHREMMTEKWDVLCGMYHKKSEPPEPLMYRKGMIGALIPGVHFNIGDVVPVDYTGLDFTLIRYDVFHKLGNPPWFKTGPTGNGNGGAWMHTEDTFFYEKCYEAKLKIGVHSGVRIAHFNKETGGCY